MSLVCTPSAREENSEIICCCLKGDPEDSWLMNNIRSNFPGDNLIRYTKLETGDVRMCVSAVRCLLSKNDHKRDKDMRVMADWQRIRHMLFKRLLSGALYT